MTTEDMQRSDERVVEALWQENHKWTGVDHLTHSFLLGTITERCEDAGYPTEEVL